MRRNRLLSAAVLAVPVFLAAGTSAHASGYAVFTHGASALGQGNAVTAHADDPSAVFYNPALITKLPGIQVEGGSTAIVTSREFRSAATGAEFNADTTLNFPIHLYATGKVTDKLSVGFGVFNPFGLESKWGPDWEGSTLTTKSTLTTYNINPAVAYKITPALSVAAGVDIIVLDAKLENSRLRFKGDGTGVGFNIGVAYDVTRDLSVGVSYRSEVDVDVDGSSSSFIPPLNSSAKSEITLPQQLTAGIAYRVSDPLTVEAGLRWEGWSAFHELQVKLDNGTPLPASPRNWSDALGCNVGAKYRLNETVSLLGGYIFGSTPVPDSTFDATIPDADTHIFTAGTDLDYKKYRVSLAYAYQHLDERTKNNALPANGTYNTDAHLIAASFLYRF